MSNRGLHDLQLMLTLARSWAKDMAYAENEIREMVKACISGKKYKRDPNTNEIVKDQEGNPIEIEIHIEEMIQSTFVLMMYIDERRKYRVRDEAIQRLMLYASAIRNFENRKTKSGVYITLDQALVLKERARREIAVIMKAITPEVLKLSKGFSDGDIEQLLALESTRQKDPMEEFKKLFSNQMT